MSTTLKNELQEHFQLYFPKNLVQEFEKAGITKLEEAIAFINKEYKRRVYKYLLNDYELLDSYGLVKFKGSLLVVDPEQSLYSNGSTIKFNEYIGVGAIDSLFKALKSELDKDIEIEHYGSSAITSTEEGFSETVRSDAKVMTIMGIKDNETGTVFWGIGESSNALRSAVDSLLSAINRMGIIKDNFK